MLNTSGKGFLLTASIYNSQNYATLLEPDKYIMEGKGSQTWNWKVWASRIENKQQPNNKQRRKFTSARYMQISVIQ